MKKTVEDVEVKGLPVLVRVDFNVPLENGRVADDSRIDAALPTISNLRANGARTILCSHLGRPKGEIVAALRLDPVAERLSELLDTQVHKLDDCIGDEVAQAVSEMADGDVILLENTRFYPQEKKNDEWFAARLAEPASLFVNDAFAAAHRAHASTVGVARHLPAVSGLLMERELETLAKILNDPKRPFAAILGGAKISDKIGVISRLLEMADTLLVGGGMANTFLAAQNIEVGRSLVEKDCLQDAARILEEAGNRIVLPVDFIAAEDHSIDADRKTVSARDVPPEWRIMDIGPQTEQLFEKRLAGAGTAVWNGPLGVTEMQPFSKGTYAVARILADLSAVTVIGGGDSGAAVARSGVADRITHVSTGGGAFLDFLEGKQLPGVAVLEDK